MNSSQNVHIVDIGVYCDPALLFWLTSLVECLMFAFDRWGTKRLWLSDIGTRYFLMSSWYPDNSDVWIARTSTSVIPSASSQLGPSVTDRIQLAVDDMTMSGWKPTISLIHPPTTISHMINHSHTGHCMHCVARVFPLPMPSWSFSLGAPTFFHSFLSDGSGMVPQARVSRFDQEFGRRVYPLTTPAHWWTQLALAAFHAQMP